MSADKQTILFELEIDQDGALTELEKSKLAIIQLKKEQADLNKAYKAGQLTQREFAQEIAKVETSLKKQQGAYGNLQRAVTGQKNVLDELTKSNKVLADQLGKTQGRVTNITNVFNNLSNGAVNAANTLKGAAGQVNIMGTNVGAAAASFAKFANPVTATIGILTALVGAYAGSAQGAKDLGLATDQLSTGFKLLLNSYGDWVSELRKDKESGFFEEAAFQINRIIYGEGIANKAKAVADANFQIRQLEIAGQFAKGFAKDREREAENLRRIRDDESQTYLARLNASEGITQKLTNNEQLRVIVLQAQAEAIKDASTNYKLDYEAQLKVAQVEAEIKDIQEEINGKLTENVNARKKILELIEAQKGVEKRLSTDPTGRGDLNQVTNTTNATDTLGLPALPDEVKLFETEKTRLHREESEKRKQQAADEAAFFHEQELIKFNAVQGIISAASAIFEEQTAAYKILASADALMNTYKGANLALGTYPPPFSYLAAAATIATGLANVAKINGAKFAHGGYTGDGAKYDPAGVVHRGEVVWNQEDVAMVGGARAADRMRPTYSGKRTFGNYADGGIVSNYITKQGNMELMMRNLLKSMPPPVVSVVDINREQAKVTVREQLSKI